MTMTGALKLCLLLTALLHASLAYDGYQVFTVTAKTEEQMETLKHIGKLGKEVNVWNDRIMLNKPINVHASPEMVDELITFLEQNDIEGDLVMEDMGQVIRDQVANRKQMVDPFVDFVFDDYHPLDEIEAWMEAMVTNHSDIAELVIIGYSFEQHPIYAMRVSNDLNGSRPVIWLDAGIHAREWVAPATLIWFINKFFEDYKTDEILSKSLETHDWYFMPVYNVDGYKFTWVEGENGTLPNRLWRRTRTPNPGYQSDCYGADPNRNWDRMWGTTTGVSFNPCDQTYCGMSPWSEPCVRHVSFYLRDQIDVDIYFGYHSFGEFYMLPYGYTPEKAADYDYLMEVCARGIARVNAVHGKAYRCDSLINLVGENSGSSVDYMYDVVGTKFAFGVELRENGTYGFLLPQEQILPCAEENFPFLLQIVEDFMNQPTSTPTTPTDSTTPTVTTTTVASTTDDASIVVISQLNIILLITATLSLITRKYA